MDLENNDLTPFQRSVLELTKKIPSGKVATYKLLAKVLGNEKLSRAVGNALNRNPFPIVVPCHRVIKSDGFIGGFAKGTEAKIKLLIKENVLINKSNKIDLRKYLVDEAILKE